MVSRAGEAWEAAHSSPKASVPIGCPAPEPRLLDVVRDLLACAQRITGQLPGALRASSSSSSTTTSSAAAMRRLRAAAAAAMRPEQACKDACCSREIIGGGVEVLGEW